MVDCDVLRDIEKVLKQQITFARRMRVCTIGEKKKKDFVLK